MRAVRVLALEEDLHVLVKSTETVCGQVVGFSTVRETFGTCTPRRVRDVLASRLLL